METVVTDTKRRVKVVGVVLTVGAVDKRQGHRAEQGVLIDLVVVRVQLAAVLELQVVVEAATMPVVEAVLVVWTLYGLIG
jgi:hypothetical protein